MKKLIVVLILIFTLIILFTACDVNNGITLTGYSFVDGIVNGNYSKSYDNCYFSIKESCTKEDFIKRYQNIFGALQVKKVKLVSRDIPDAAEDQETYIMNYTLELDSSLIGNVRYDYQATIMKDVSGYSVEFNPSLILPYMESGDTVRVETLEGKRGEIFAQDKVLVAVNSFADTVYINVNDVSDIENTASRIASITGADSGKIIDEYYKAVDRGYDVVKVKAYSKNSLTDEEKAEILAVTGVGINSDSLTPARYYPYQDSLAHIIGYCNAVTAEDIEKDSSLSDGDVAGKTGLEFEFNDILTGKDGKKIYVRDSAGNEKYVIYEEPADNGTDIELTVDIDEQNKAFSLLSAYLKEGQSGCAIVMDYSTGAVRAAVSYPSFDPNWFSIGVDEAHWKYLNDEKSQYPLFNRLTQAVYQPGSTFKVFTAVPVIEGGIVDPDEEIYLDIKDNKWKPTDDMLPEDSEETTWVYPEIKRAHETKGELTLVNAIKSSDNIFFAYLALQTGKENMKNYLESIGVGEAIPFELPVTASQFKKDDTDYTLHLLATSGYGMGEIEITPVQLASMYTAFMNNGDILCPFVVNALNREENGDYVQISQTDRKVFKEKIMRGDTIETMTRAMRLVVTTGTAYPLDVKDYDIFGKTGTATLVSSGENSREVNWVILLSREKGNEKLVLVMVDSKADEGDNKFNIARGLILPDKPYYGNEEQNESNDSADNVQETGQTEDVSELTISQE